MAEIKNSILAGIFFGVSMGIVFSLMYGSKYGIISGILSGLFFGIAIYMFAKSKVVQIQTQLENIEEQKISYSGGTNHFVNTEADGGKLYLLTDSLQFKAHSCSIQYDCMIILSSQIKIIRCYNTFGLLRNRLLITTGTYTDK